MFVLAHLSDPHLGPLPRPQPMELAGKRALGFINWQRNRKVVHRGEVLRHLVSDLKAQTVDHIAVTGDLVNIALPGEFAPARVFLEMLGPPEKVTLVPGNHDFYVRGAAEFPAHHWGDYMRGDGAMRGQDGGEAFPFLRRRGSLAIIGLSTGVPTRPFMATGLLGPEQLRRFGDMLAQFDRSVFRVVLIHHPPQSAAPRRHKRLIDAPAFRETLARHGADLVLHGHDHIGSLVWLDGKDGRIPAFGVPSASAGSGHHDDPAAYNLYRIAREGNAWRCETVTRGFRRNGDAIGELKTQVLSA